MSKKMYDVMVSELEAMLNSVCVDLLSVEQASKKNDDGTLVPFTRLEVEIPRGNGAYSRCRFFCKLPPTNLSFTQDDLDNGISVTLSGLKVTFISAQHEIYTRADGIQMI